MPPSLEPRTGALLELHDRLLDHFGPQHWWPGNGPWDVCAGAVLTQNTQWTSAERALGALAGAGMDTPERILDAADSDLEALIRPAGFFRQKRRALKALAGWVVDGGGFVARGRLEDHDLRTGLLALPGIGPETADCILLYGFHRPVFVADAYARRILSRTGLWRAGSRTAEYSRLKAWAETRLPGDPALLNEFHALLVALGKTHCLARPRCEVCPASGGCRYAATGRPGTGR